MKLSRAAVLAIILLGSCTNEGGHCPPSALCAPPGDVAARGGTVVFGFVGSPATLDPYSHVASDLTYELAAPVYPSLYRFDPEGKPHPYLAETMRKVPGGVRVRLRAAKWSDGRAVSSADLLASQRRARSPSGFSRITSARALGPREIELRGQVANWKQTLATVAYVLPGGRATRLSAGPFKVASYTPGLQVVFRRNQQWWGKAHLEQVTVEFMPSLQVMMMLAARGDLDAAAPPSTINLDSRVDAAGWHHSAALGWESIQLRLPSDRLDLEARRSLAGTVDRRVLESGFVRSLGRVANTLHPGPGPGGADGPWQVVPKTGPTLRERVKLSAPSGDELIELLQRVLQRQLSTKAPDLELATVDPQTFYGPWTRTDPTDIALTRVAGAPGASSDRRAYRLQTALPLFQVKTFIAWRDGLGGLEADPTFDGPLWNLQDWYRIRRNN